jgi:membrane-associated phospholipid phosphatase
VLSLGSAALVVLLWAGTTQTVAGQRVADLILYGRIAADPTLQGAANAALGTIHLLSVGVTMLGLVAIALARGGLGLAVGVVAILADANLTTQGLETLLERPHLLGHAAYATVNSFPSGHVTIVASIGLTGVFVVPRRVRTPAAIAAAIAVAAMGASTMTSGWHRLADVEGGILIALGWASLVTAILVRAQGWMPRRTWGRGLGGRTTGLVGGAGAAVAIAGVGGVALAVADPTPLADLVATGSTAPDTFAAALAIAVGTSVLACAAYVWSMRGVAVELPG